MFNKLLATAVVLAALMAHASLTAATQVYKCMISGVVTYQSDPCPSGVARNHPTVEQLNTERQKKLLQARDGVATPSTSTPGGQRPPSSFGAASEPPARNEKTRKQTPVAPLTPPTVLFKCDGRKYCTQMSSCAEAKYFLAHCPTVKMDGDGDGIPCEQQWCN